jgi:hypothetical protein
MDCLLIAAVPPSSGRRKHGQLHASRVQARSSQATLPTDPRLTGCVLEGWQTTSLIAPYWSRPTMPSRPTATIAVRLCSLER